MIFYQFLRIEKSVFKAGQISKFYPGLMHFLDKCSLFGRKILFIEDILKMLDINLVFIGNLIVNKGVFGLKYLGNWRWCVLNFMLGTVVIGLSPVEKFLSTILFA